MISFKLIAKSSHGIGALERFQKDCDILLVRRLLNVQVVNYDPFVVEVKPNQFMAGTIKTKNNETMKKAKHIIHEQWLKKYDVVYGIDYEVE
jgi:hypothetical protein